VAVDRATRHGFRGWAARHPPTVFLLVLFSIAYPLMALPILASHGVIPGGSLPAKLNIAPDELAGALLTFTALLPATLFATWATDGREGLRRLLHRMVHWRVGIGWWLVAAFITAGSLGFVHWPLAFFGDFTAASVAGALALYITLGLIFRPMIGVVLRGAGSSILLVAVLHSMFNRTNNENGIAASILSGDGRATAIPLAVIVLTAVTALIIRRRLSRAHRLHLDAQPLDNTVPAAHPDPRPSH
jgi:hypothetical protein